MYSAKSSQGNLACLVREDHEKEYTPAAKAGVIYLDPALRVKSLNREAEKILGVSQAAALGKRADKAFAHLGERMVNAISMAGREEFFAANIRFSVNDSTSYLRLDSFRFRDHGGRVCGIMLAVQDVSEVRAAIKQIQTTQMLMSLGELAAGVAHHVRTPLTTIGGYLQIMMNRLEDDRYKVRREVLAMLLDEVSYINNVVKELVLFAKPPVRKEPGIQLTLLLEETVDQILKPLDPEKIRVIWDLSQVPTITADANLLQQALGNVIQNAVEAMPGFGILTLRTWLNSEMGMLVIAIADTGEGVAPQILPRVFEPFYSSKLDRIGLGLPTAHRIVYEHGGFINIFSEQAIGTRVHIYLPLTDPKSRQAAQPICQEILNLQ